LPAEEFTYLSPQTFIKIKAVATATLIIFINNY